MRACVPAFMRTCVRALTHSLTYSLAHLLAQYTDRPEMLCKRCACCVVQNAIESLFVSMWCENVVSRSVRFVLTTQRQKSSLTLSSGFTLQSHLLGKIMNIFSLFVVQISRKYQFCLVTFSPSSHEFFRRYLEFLVDSLELFLIEWGCCHIVKNEESYINMKRTEKRDPFSFLFLYVFDFA